MRHDSTDEISLLTADGETLAGDLGVPAGAPAGAVLCHPHPAHGGDRHNVVIDALHRAMGAAGLATLRFDFRRGQPRAASGEGVAERADVVAALHRLATEVDRAVPLFLVGYSFGADVALAVGDDRHAGWALVAPPFRFSGPARPASGDPRPVLVMTPAHDQFAPPHWVGRATQGWPDVTVEPVPMADHFLAGATAQVARAVTAWIVDRASSADTAG
ncbi:MAG: alpha/beta hydrolase [Acidimicrobiales bacterium]|nr:alpha/beta hydrolase [Acidimicrobiales bacterium]